MFYNGNTNNYQQCYRNQYKDSKIWKLIKLYFAGTVFVDVHSAELVFVGIVFVSFIISTHITTGSPILLSHLPFS